VKTLKSAKTGVEGHGPAFGEPHHADPLGVDARMAAEHGERSICIDRHSDGVEL
jgi:hypothetical protein